MITMNRQSSETMPASTDRRVSSSYPTLRGMGCEAHVSQWKFENWRKPQPATHMKHWRQPTPAVWL
jgi:hypothetical protein